MRLRGKKINKYLCGFKKNHLRYFIKLAYNGTHYHGWQYQPNAASVQETMNKAFSVLLNTTINLMGAGRTDTGVHAKEMYAHFDFDKSLDTPSLVHKLNSYLPKDIVIYDIIPVHDDAHTRFDATKRTYEYHINTFKDAFSQEQSWYFHQKLDIDMMNEAARILFNHTDFQCFSKVNTDVNTFDCSIFEAYWKQENGNLIFTISANRFLRNMVRAIVGTLVNIGLHKITLADFTAIIESKNRDKAGFSVPAHGLYLTKIEYDYL
jgi:tRNA pseudouridine38-40 synthase